ncbi:MAG: hypothetical protein K6B38_04645 [Ruminococcus sp.]|nr:hypothetical protein [Ruminococcus sp.]
MKANTKNTKGGSPMKKLIPAAGMLMVSATMLATSTFAWFTMNKEVQVTNMQVKAKAEKGLLVNEVATITDTNWDELATSTLDTSFQLIPMSTLNGATWNHANSAAANDAGKAQSATAKGAKLTSAGYEFYTLATTASGSNLSSKKLDFINTAATAGSQAETNIYYKETSTAGAIDEAVDDGAFVKYTYYLKSSSSSDITVDADTTDEDGDKVYVKSITISGLDATTVESATTLSHDLDKTLRVGIKVSDGASTPTETFYTFAPVAGADESYFIATANDTFAATADSVQTGTKTLGEVASGKTTCTATYSTGLAIGTLPSTVNAAGGKRVDVYLWFEGEDSNCKTDNIYTNLNELSVDIVFGLI